MFLFLTKEKTNWRFVIVVIVIAALAGGGIFYSLNRFGREIIYLSQFSKIEKPERVVESQLIVWENYQIISAMTREPISEVSFMLPETVGKPLCGQSACYSQGAELPGKTRFQVAARGEGEYLFSSWEEFKEYLIKEEFMFVDISVNNKTAIEFWKDAIGSTHGGDNFSKMRGVVIKLDDKKFIEINLFIPESQSADFESDNRLFNQILSTFRFIEPKDIGWQTYKNEEFGFEIRYPSRFKVSSEGPNVAQQAIDRGEGISGTIASSYDTIIFFENFKEVVRIEIFHQYEKDILEENYRDKAHLYLYGPCDLRWRYSPNSIGLGLINNIRMLIVKGEMTMIDFESGETKEIIPQNCYYLKNPNENLIVFSNKGYKLEIFNEIISTFVFYEEEKEPEEEFCGWSTQGVCVSDADCIVGGCSNQVCQSKNEEPVITTCEFRECYLAQNYGIGCKCIDNKCQWSK